MSAHTSIQSTLFEQPDEIGRVERDEDGHLRSCPVCPASWSEWDSTDGQNPLVEHLEEFHTPVDFGLSPMGGRQ